MTPQVENILSFYDSENPGIITNLSRLLNHGYLKGTGKMVILPVDQGFEHGPIMSFLKNPDAHDPHYHFNLAIKSGCNAYAAPLGFLQAGARRFAGEIPLILKLNSSDTLYKNNTSPIPALTASVDAALQLGCVAVGFTIYPGSEARKQMYEEFAHISKYARQKGLVVVVWSYPRGSDITKKHETSLDVVAYATHIAAQLGAHIIKVKPPSQDIKNTQTDNLIKDTIAQHATKNTAFYNTNYENPANQKVKTTDTQNLKIDTLSDRVRYIMKAAFNNRRIVIFSGGGIKDRLLFTQEIKELAKGGSFGSIVGRNAFNRPLEESIKLLREVMDIYKTSG